MVSNASAGATIRDFILYILSDLFECCARAQFALEMRHISFFFFAGPCPLLLERHLPSTLKVSRGIRDEDRK